MGGSLSATVKGLREEQRRFKQRQSHTASTMASFSASKTYSISQYRPDGGGVVWANAQNPKTLICSLVIPSLDDYYFYSFVYLPVFENGKCGWRIWFYSYNEGNVSVPVTVISNQEVTLE